MSQIVGLIIVLFGLGLSGCGLKNVNSEGSQPTTVISPVGAAQIEADSQEVSMKSDRGEIEKLRSEIPEEVKKHNDEIAMVLSYIYRESEEEPMRLRDRFQAALRKRREAMDKHLRRSRESFSKEERRNREDHLKRAKEEREKYLSGKRNSEDRKVFFADQEDRRRVFFSEQTEKRKEFESQVQEERKKLEDFIREKQNQFNQEWREYQARYAERRRLNDTKKKMERKASQLEAQPAAAPVATPDPTKAEVDNSGTSASKVDGSLEEFERIPKGPAVPLVPGKKGP